MYDNTKKLVSFLFNTGSQFLDFVVENPEKTVAAIGVVVTLLNATKSLQVTHRNKQEQKRKDYTYYDPHTGMRWDLRRRMTNNDRIYISQKRKIGKSMDSILKERGLI